ncbi:hypothetical protein Lser_V15G39929 [Lactuca serriola]
MAKPTEIAVKSLLLCVETRLPINQISNSINMVPSGLRDLSPSSFNPRVVSIGPLHREDENLKAFERVKATYMHDLLELFDPDMEKSLSECVQKVATSMEQIKETYARKIPYDDAELTQIMVVDACFILQFIRELSESKCAREYLFRSSSIIYDLVLIENQIPFFILQAIFDCTFLTSDPEASLNCHILKLVPFLNVFEISMLANNDHGFPHDHILGFLDKYYWAPDDYSYSPGSPSSEIHSVVELDRAGVNFKPNLDEKWIMAIEFKSSASASASASGSWSLGYKPTLQMPVLRIDNFTELILRNLIAYEQSCTSPGYVTSYVTAMDMLVDTQDDISKLIESKVVVNHLGSNLTAAKMINSLCKELPLPNFYYVDQWKKLDSHYNSYWPKNIATFKRTYFSSPWAIVALLAGIALFGLTVAQTIAAF